MSPGQVDWRKHAPRVLPANLSGLRALDVGTFDGFWAFQMERRGAGVVAIDLESVGALELPPPQRARVEHDEEKLDVELGRGFRLAAKALGSSVERIPCDVYELDASKIGGQVDVAFVGALLEHLRDPVRALEGVRSVLRPGGRLIVLEAVSISSTFLFPRTAVAAFKPLVSYFSWWRPNVAALRAYLETAGFTNVRTTSRLMRPPAKPEMRSVYCRVEGRVRHTDK